VHFLTSCNHVCERSVSWKVLENVFLSPGNPGIWSVQVLENSVLMSVRALFLAFDGYSWNVQTFMTVLPASSVVIQLQPDMGIYTDFLKFQLINRVQTLLIEIQWNYLKWNLCRLVLVTMASFLNSKCLNPLLCVSRMSTYY